jgi:hypothetical protein
VVQLVHGGGLQPREVLLARPDAHPQVAADAAVAAHAEHDVHEVPVRRVAQHEQDAQLLGRRDAGRGLQLPREALVQGALDAAPGVGVAQRVEGRQHPLVVAVDAEAAAHVVQGDEVGLAREVPVHSGDRLQHPAQPLGALRERGGEDVPHLGAGVQDVDLHGTDAMDSSGWKVKAGRPDRTGRSSRLPDMP